jgi:hypothetical protein
MKLLHEGCGGGTGSPIAASARAEAAARVRPADGAEEFASAPIFFLQSDQNAL